MNKSYSPPYLWRLIFTALSFALFGLGGLLLRLIVFPLLSLLPASPLVKEMLNKSKNVIASVAKQSN